MSNIHKFEKWRGARELPLGTEWINPTGWTVVSSQSYGESWEWPEFLLPDCDNQPDGFKSEDADAIKEQGGSA